MRLEQLPREQQLNNPLIKGLMRRGASEALALNIFDAAEHAVSMSDSVDCVMFDFFDTSPAFADYLMRPELY